MRALTTTSLTALCVLFVAIPACRERKDDATQAGQALAPVVPSPIPDVPASVVPPAPPAPPPLVSLIQVGDETVAGQLLNGFFDAQVGIWRWTAPAFTAKLAVPAGAAQKGAVLHLTLTLPQQLVAQHASVVVTAKVNEAVASKKFSNVGDYQLDLDVPPAALSGNSVVAEFTVDKPYVPGGQDVRSLGVIAKTIELASK